MELKLVVEPENPKHYHGKPCKKCGGSLRFVRHRGCVACSVQRGRAWRTANQDRRRERARTYHLETKETRKHARKDAELKHAYGISLDAYNNMLLKQKGRCAICAEESSRLNVDHCHDTGRVRGLLCGCCNRALGLMKDNPQTIANAVAYLNRTQKATNAE